MLSDELRYKQTFCLALSVIYALLAFLCQVNGIDVAVNVAISKLAPLYRPNVLKEEGSSSFRGRTGP